MRGHQYFSAVQSEVSMRHVPHHVCVGYMCVRACVRACVGVCVCVCVLYVYVCPKLNFLFPCHVCRLHFPVPNHFQLSVKTCVDPVSFCSSPAVIFLANTHSLTHTHTHT